jgi:hypothetical protein
MIFLPGRAIFSRTITLPPANLSAALPAVNVCAAPAAAMSPAAPPPIIIMSALVAIFRIYLPQRYIFIVFYIS